MQQAGGQAGSWQAAATPAYRDLATALDARHPSDTEHASSLPAAFCEQLIRAVFRHYLLEIIKLDPCCDCIASSS